MSPKPVTDSMLMSSMPPATTNEALPAAILSTASSTETAAVAQAPTGWIIDPYPPTKDCIVCAAMTLASASWRRSWGRSRPRNRSM